MEFAVVKFSKDGTSSEIPVKWIIGTYEKARHLAENLNYTSEDDGQSGRGRRTKFRNTRYQDTSDDENNNGRFSSLDLPPSLATNTSPQEDNTELNINELPIIYEESPTIERTTTEGTRDSFNEENVQIAQSLDLNSYQQGLLNLQELKDQLFSIQRIVVRLDLKIDDLAQRVDKIGPLPKLIGTTKNIQKILPLSSREAVDNFEKHLENTTIMNEFLIYIDRVCGNTPEENVRQIFSEVFTNEFAKNHTWAGRKNKFCDSQLKMIRTMKDKISSEWAGFRENNFDREGKEWFRLGNQRFTREETKKWFF
ncbi:uncharacterized protein [Chelonus insularis]|uniref:uncharacterized protein n=1 Tax=Chelonus insularis TaxID=460826 RepID=UPI00158D3B01|nr:uncharacterized protein LOC118070742 [Chelonus insularis]